MTSKSVLVVSIALTVIAVQAAETTTWLSLCLDGTNRSVTCTGDCSASKQKCSGNIVLGGVARCVTGSQSTISLCSNSTDLCDSNPCRTWSPQMCGTRPDKCGGFINCGPCELCLGMCYRSRKCCSQDSDCAGSPGSASGDPGSGSGTGLLTDDFCVMKWSGIGLLMQ